MDNETAAKLAKALGVMRGCSIGALPGLLYNHDGKGTYVCTEGGLELWLNSADGERTVRNQVRKLCGKLGFAFEFRWWPTTDDDGQFGLALGPVHYLDGGSFLTIEHFEEGQSEREAWQAALLWLDERKGK